MLEALVHGYRAGLLVKADYESLTQCETLEDMKLHLSGTDYKNFMKNDTNLTPSVFTKKATDILVKQFDEAKFHASEPLSTFLDFISFDYIISNVLKLITAVRDNSSKALSVMYKCHPLGLFETMGAITAASSIDEMYEMVLVDSPIGPFFTKTDKRDFDEFSTDYIKALLNKNYLESFYDFVNDEIGGVSAEVMNKILEFEADRSVLTITTQSFGSKDLPKEERKKLYPNFGPLVDVQDKLADCDSWRDLVEIVKPFKEYHAIIEKISKKEDQNVLAEGGNQESLLLGGDNANPDEEVPVLETWFKERAVELCKDAFMQQFNYGIFYAFVKLKEQEIKNIYWIAECIKQDERARAKEYIPIY